jgi:hypothetical protein
MRQSVSNVSLEAGNVSVVILSPATKLKEEWLFLFRKPLADLPNTLSPVQKAVLLDIMSLGSTSPQGLLSVNVLTLLGHGVSRASVYRALGVLGEFGLIAGPKDGAVYLSPRVVYRGHARDWGYAMVYWKQLGGKYEE